MNARNPLLRTEPALDGAGEAATAEGVLRRLSKRLRVPVERFTRPMRREFEPFVREVLGGEEESFADLVRCARILLLDGRTRRSRARRDQLDADRAAQAWADPDERQRAAVFNAELGRLAEHFGGTRADSGSVQQFRKDVLAGRLLSPAKADEFIRKHERTSHGAALRTLGEQLSRHYMWDAEQARWWVLTGALPYPPFFTMRPEGGWRHDHEQYRVTISVPLWVRGSTVVRMLKALRARVQGQTNRPLSPSRLEVVGFVAPLRHAGKSWREVAVLWNKSHPGRKRDPRNLERDFSDTYELLMRAKLTFPTSAAPEVRNEAKLVKQAAPSPSRARASRSRPRPQPQERRVRGRASRPASAVARGAREETHARFQPRTGSASRIRRR